MKVKRHAKIIELIREFPIVTQDELGELLKQAGFDVTQATISRDIRELKLTKVTGDDGVPRYAVLSSVVSQFSDRFIRVFRDGVTSFDHAQNMIVIKTFEGMAMAVGACIDAMRFSEILGCIAGDDTVFCVTRGEQEAFSLIGKFKEIIQAE